MGGCLSSRQSAAVSPCAPPQISHEIDPNPDPDFDTPAYFSFPEFFASSDSRVVAGMRFERELGKGAMSRVYLAIVESSNEPVAVKVYSNAQLFKPVLEPEEPLYKQVQREVDLMAGIAHRYILPILEVIACQVTNSTFLVLPFAAQGTLQSLLDSGSLAPSEFPICFFQIAEAFRYLHENNIVHRDLKPDNILCCRPQLYVVSDFSVSAQLESADAKLDDTKGSPAFLSPEECSGASYDAKAADVWAFGVCIYRAVFGYFPFNLEKAHGMAVVATIIMVKELLETEELVIPELPDGVDEGVIELMRMTMEKDVTKRPTFERVLEFEYLAPGKEFDAKLCEQCEQGEFDEED
jgi:serine/threonine protein kinase